MAPRLTSSTLRPFFPVREPDGLAMSSRNAYLSEKVRGIKMLMVIVPPDVTT